MSISLEALAYWNEAMGAGREIVRREWKNSSEFMKRLNAEFDRAFGEQPNEPKEK